MPQLALYSLIICILCCQKCFTNAKKKRVLLVIPGLGTAKRLSNVVLQLTSVFSNDLPPLDVKAKREWDCVSFVYADDDNEDFWVHSRKGKLLISTAHSGCKIFHY